MKITGQREGGNGKTVYETVMGVDELHLIYGMAIRLSDELPPNQIDLIPTKGRLLNMIKVINAALPKERKMRWGDFRRGSVAKKSLMTSANNKKR